MIVEAQVIEVAARVDHRAEDVMIFRSKGDAEQPAEV
jgi:hypothetical protein